MMGLHAPVITVVVLTNDALLLQGSFTADSAGLSFTCTHLTALCIIIRLMRDKILKRKAAEELPFPSFEFSIQSCQCGSVTGIGAVVSVSMCNGCKWLCCTH